MRINIISVGLQYSPAMRKKANFAKNFGGKKKK